ncbi:MAG TPA: hemerythrin domain-containing protein [Planctomycetota bacterium]|nr:hemerythrin domain-containing protein [Planctomycetota bacterium]
MPLRVTAELREDHALIRRGLAELRRLADQVDAGMRFPADAVASVARFLREFAEHQHHRKEESLLLATLAAHGADDAAEGVGELLRDHEESRALFYTLILFWEPTQPLTAEESAAFVQVARTYADRLERHMEVEESRFFPLADRVIPGDEQVDLSARFQEIDAGRRTRSQWAELLAELREA